MRFTVDVFITGVFQTEINHLIRCGHDLRRIDITRKGVPGVPS
jgi:hypothetical protein